MCFVLKQTEHRKRINVLKTIGFTFYVENSNFYMNYSDILVVDFIYGCGFKAV